MPVRSLNSSILKWPDAQTVDRAIRRWAEKVVLNRSDVLCIGYFGSYARGDWGVGSDLDLIIVVERAEQPFERRGVQWDVTDLPVPTDLLVYTREEWQSFTPDRRFLSSLTHEAIWVYGKSIAPCR
jgi:predicted nucleotidyltransferase